LLTFQFFAGVPDHPSLRLKLASLADKDRLVDYMFEHFVTQEPVFQAAGLNRSNGEQMISDWIQDCLKDPVSFLIVDSASDVIVGCMMNMLVRQDQDKPGKTRKHPEETFMEKLLDQLSKKVCITLRKIQ